MTTDFEVDILPDNSAGTNLLIRLTASDPELSVNRKEFLREVAIDIDANTIRDLRGGNPTSAVVNAVAQKLSDWLISSDIRGYVNGPILGTKPVRFIFRFHPRLLEKFADVPVELLKFEDEWVVLRHAVSAIVHELPGTQLSKPFYHSLPLKILVVRSSPSGLTVRVPPAGPICNHIVKLANELGQNIVHIDLISGEARSLEPQLSWDEFEAKHLPNLVIADGDSEEERQRKESLKWREFRDYLLNRGVTELQPATWEKFTDHLKNSSTNYHILVYLGHGNYLNLDGSGKKSGVLQFEKPGGVNVDNISSNDLQRQLQDRQVAIPVVMLAGCLTAAENEPPLDAEELKDIAEWTLGSQGVAQRLVGTSSGVQCAVGMRYQIKIGAAFDFLATFFESLLRETPGNVEAAVRAGRVKISRPEYPPSWSAPVIFRTRGAEPMFNFDIPRTYKLDRDNIRDQDVREAAWTALSEDPTSDFAYETLAEIEKLIKAKATKKQTSLLMPEMKKAAPDEVVEVAVNLVGALQADKLDCKLSVSSDHGNARIESLHSTQPFKDSKFSLGNMSESGGSDITFTITRGAGAFPLPEGPILVVRLRLAPVAPAKHTVRLDVVEVVPPNVKVRPIDNVVLVSGK
ncbi:MAG TPA: CHAT domain-containing protein [Pyrinomonadaceae bacterium]